MWYIVLQIVANRFVEVKKYLVAWNYYTSGGGVLGSICPQWGVKCYYSLVNITKIRVNRGLCIVYCTNTLHNTTLKLTVLQISTRTEKSRAKYVY